MEDKVDVLDKGYVHLRDHMGDDVSVVNAARVSFDKRSEWEQLYEYREHDPEYDSELFKIPAGKRIKDKDSRLLNYLATHGHWSPFSHCFVSLEIKAPVMVVNQLYKHRVGSRFTELSDEGFDDAWNEMSGRYVSEDLEFYVPEEWRNAPENKKQGSGEPVHGLYQEEATLDMNQQIENSMAHYQWCLDVAKIAPEQARLFLPYAAMYTKLIWTPSLYTIIRFLGLREDEHSQWEIRQYAAAVHELVEPLFPESFKAFGLEGK